MENLHGYLNARFYAFMLKFTSKHKTCMFSPFSASFYLPPLHHNGKESIPTISNIVRPNFHVALNNMKPTTKTQQYMRMHENPTDKHTHW